MKQNRYDDLDFFDAYSRMNRSVKGLAGAGEWPVFKACLPDLENKSVLDLGCGYGWHCLYAHEQGAEQVTGVDLSENMLSEAREKAAGTGIRFERASIEDYAYRANAFDVVMSSLAFHYVRDFQAACRNVHSSLKPGGSFVFSVEHPMFTCREEQEWHRDETGSRLHWPVDRYQDEGERRTSFLAEGVMKYHRTFSTYMETLLDAGFAIKAVKEPGVTEQMLEENPDLKDEGRRPMFLIIAAEKVI
ncbi:SAM-dependent methyltransferase [Alteribacter lacisalsi]|uniref:SAM-dependent methyltransferase n=1 Tax=Alteribacter lacisalsi TaxID=2045244 RepID=A0A2W0H5Q5_9BACI|nr:class I SAM-dependent methyltransferase [Alteribacter lacisalsi]PYZ96351.1 SAM-dependent methyltransferase [Alteribacter lacisalsi]